jgi:iron complex outermembrane recepter protein
LAIVREEQGSIQGGKPPLLGTRDAPVRTDKQRKDWDVTNAKTSQFRAALKTGAASLVMSAMLAGPAFAQTEAADASTGEAETIVVTGSRIARPQLEGASPVTVINAAEVKLQGTTRVEDLVNNLPQAFASLGGNLSNGSTGTATVNLRGIGAARTLVLINGRRLVPGDPTFPVPDLNAIPAALIERVDVLTGGASSVYGADAVAGVVNFVMDSDFEGFKVDAQYSFFQHDNSGDDRAIAALNARNFAFPDGNTVGGGQFDGTLTFGVGTDDGRGHLTAYAGYRKIKAVLQEDYDFSSCALNASTTADAFTCGGSGTTAPAQIFAFRNADLTGAIDANPAVAGTQNFTPRGPGGAFRPYSAATDAFNFGPYNYFQRPDERFTLGAFAEYEVNEMFTPYMELSFMDDRTLAQIAPSGAFGVVQTIDCSNPLLSASQRTALCPDPGQTQTTLLVLRRNVEGGGRVDDLRHTKYRIVAGFKGDFSENWSYDMYGQFGRTLFNQVYFNDFSTTRLQRAFDVVAGPGGVPTCRSVVDGTDPNCVPYNIFTGTTSIQGGVTQGVTQAALDYLQTPGFSRGQTTEQVLSLSVSGDLGINSPFAEDTVGLAVGAEYRKSSLEFDTDLAFSTGDLSGQGGPTIGLAGSFDVKEVFGEVRIPLVQDVPFFNDLSIEAGYRYSDYQTNGDTGSNSFSTDTYKLGAEWSPVEAIRFRGSYNRAVRAPNVVELFAAQAIGLFAGVDPCANEGGNPPAFTLAQCQNTGVSAAQYGNIVANPAQQYNQFTGGNPNLDPEKADTYTFGVVIAPRSGFLSGFSATVDYFDIKVENLISTVGAQLILNQCGQTGDPTFCSLVRRAPGTGSLYLNAQGNPQNGGSGFVVNTNTNVGGLRTKGIDVALDYRMDLGEGGLAFNLVGTYLDEFVTNPGVPTVVGGQTFNSYDCKGFYGVTCGVPAPEWRHKLRVTYTAPSVFSASLNWRYVGKVRDEFTSSNPFISGTTYPAHDRIDSFSYFDLALSADVTEMATFRVGVNNILDKDPPIIGQQSQSAVFANGNTYPQVYDTLGRYIYVGATFSF